MKVLITSFRNDILQWENGLAARLRSAGHETYIDYCGPASSAPFLKSVLALEGKWTGAGAQPVCVSSIEPSSGDPDVVIDLTGKAAPGGIPVLTLEVGQSSSLSEGLLGLRTGSGLVDLIVRCDGKPVGRASPMIQDRVWLSRDINALLVSVHSLFVQVLARLRAGVLHEIAVPSAGRAAGRGEWGYVKNLVCGLTWRRLEKMTPGRREFSWKTAYRFIDGPGIAQSRQISGTPFTFLEDDGQRFYADPFPIEHEGRIWLFVEEYPYALGRGVVSVAELGADGRFDRPRIVLQEPHHLSYPNVFAHGGDIFMIPESGSANEVVLYRAAAFPDQWHREAVLVEGLSFNDATLLNHQGKFWMFGTERFANGSPSDTMMIYSAEHLRGPWTPHPLNPVVIDRAGARPGGKVVEVNGKFFLPVQNGTETYGGGLGLREIIRLDLQDVRFGPTLPICEAASGIPASLHTLNRAGRLEVIDRLQ